MYIKYIPTGAKNNWLLTSQIRLSWKRKLQLLIGHCPHAHMQHSCNYWCVILQQEKQLLWEPGSSGLGSAGPCRARCLHRGVWILAGSQLLRQPLARVCCCRDTGAGSDPAPGLSLSRDQAAAAKLLSTVPRTSSFHERSCFEQMCWCWFHSLLFPSDWQMCNRFFFFIFKRQSPCYFHVCLIKLHI